MRLKKGFTLAEILIVLMVIGVIATMTIPSMMKGVTEAQLKAGYKKAYNTIANFAAMERVSGALPSRGNAENVALLYQSLNAALSVKSFAQQDVNAGSVLQNNDENYPTCINATINETETKIGYGDDCHTLTTGTTDMTGGIDGISGADAHWIITEDNIAYTILEGGRNGNKNCATKQEIASLDSDADAAEASCLVMIVDVNGMAKGPNTLEEQGLPDAIPSTESLVTLTGDQYKIYFGIDGATPGPRVATVTGRIMADLK